MTEKIVKCVYPKCNNLPLYLDITNMNLCQEHYDLTVFIKEIIFCSSITINPYANKFKEEFKDDL